MGQHLVIDEFVALGRLDDAVQRQNPAEPRILENLEILVFGFFLEEGLFYEEPELEIAVKRFGEPSHGMRPRLCSLSWIESVLNIRRRTGTALYGSQLPHMNRSIAAYSRSGHV